MYVQMALRPYLVVGVEEDVAPAGDVTLTHGAVTFEPPAELPP